jgi:glycosyltransferase involved in cell wall biosynthesis
MKVVHVSTNERRGGASIAAERLHAGLRRAGVDSSMFVRERHSNSQAILQANGSPKRFGRMAYRWRKRKLAQFSADVRNQMEPGADWITDTRTADPWTVPEQLPTCDVINLHWVTGLIDWQSLFKSVAGRIPLVWTLHDMNPMTGGCHYSGGCQRFDSQCGRCPLLGSNSDHDPTRAIWKRKCQSLSLLSPMQLQIVADSTWLAARAQESSLLKQFKIRVIHYGIDTDVFRPRSRMAARASLGITDDALVVLFVAESVTNRRKGLGHLVGALRLMSEIPKLFLLSVGGDACEVPIERSLHLGAISNERMLAIAYSAADVFVIPSLEEAFGQTALEAMACGIPVVGFNIGGIPDIVVPGETGYLAKGGDVEDLARQLRLALSNTTLLQEMGARCRRMVEQFHTLECQARQYCSVYEQALATWKAS